jgi:hypothetical protein
MDLSLLAKTQNEVILSQNQRWKCGTILSQGIPISPEQITRYPIPEFVLKLPDFNFA